MIRLFVLKRKWKNNKKLFFFDSPRFRQGASVTKYFPLPFSNSGEQQLQLDSNPSPCDEEKRVLRIYFLQGNLSYNIFLCHFLSPITSSGNWTQTLDCMMRRQELCHFTSFKRILYKTFLLWIFILRGQAASAELKTLYLNMRRKEFYQFTSDKEICYKIFSFAIF
jgi:hypothetical protein